PPREGTWAWTLFAASILVLAALSAAYSQLDDLVRAFHDPGRATFGAGAAVDPARFWDNSSANNLNAAVCTWVDFLHDPDICLKPSTASISALREASVRPPSNARTVLGWQLGVVDSIGIIPTYLLAAAFLVRLLRRAIRDMD